MNSRVGPPEDTVEKHILPKQLLRHVCADFGTLRCPQKAKTHGKTLRGTIEMKSLWSLRSDTKPCSELVLK